MSVKEEDHEGSQGPKSPLSSSGDEEEKAAYGALSDDDIDVDDEKTKRILAACETRNIDDLQELAMSKGGFLSDANRAHACESSPARHFCFCLLFLPCRPCCHLHDVYTFLLQGPYYSVL